MLTDISSHSNPKYKYLKSLSKSRNRKKENVYLMEGRPELDIALGKGLEPEWIAFSESYITLEELEHLGVSDSTPKLRLSKALFDDLAYQHVPGNFMAVFPSWDVTPNSLDFSKPIVVLESVEKPGNLGAILRSCDAFGIADVLVTETDIDLFNPNVLRNSRGAVFSVRCSFCSNEEAHALLSENGADIYAAALTEGAIDYRQVERKPPLAMVFGAESIGLSSFWLERAQPVVIPMAGTVDSLNVSVSCAVILSHLSSP